MKRETLLEKMDRKIRAAQEKPPDHRHERAKAIALALSPLDDQQRELEAIFQGKKGGPMEVLASLVATWLPTKCARVNVNEDGDSITMATEGAGELRSQLLRDPEGTPFTLQGGGFVSLFGMEMAELAPTATQWADPELPHSFETKSGARGDLIWSG